MSFHRVSQGIRAILAVAMLVVMLAPVPYLEHRAGDLSFSVGPDYHPGHDVGVRTGEPWTFWHHAMDHHRSFAVFSIPLVALALVAWELLERAKPTAKRRIAARERLFALLATLAVVAVLTFDLDIFGEDTDLIGLELLQGVGLGILILQVIALAPPRELHVPEAP